VARVQSWTLRRLRERRSTLPQTIASWRAPIATVAPTGPGPFGLLHGPSSLPASRDRSTSALAVGASTPSALQRWRLCVGARLQRFYSALLLRRSPGLLAQIGCAVLGGWPSETEGGPGCVVSARQRQACVRWGTRGYKWARRKLWQERPSAGHPCGLGPIRRRGDRTTDGRATADRAPAAGRPCADGGRPCADGRQGRPMVRAVLRSRNRWNGDIRRKRPNAAL
jgi:hypothetical protein